MKTTLLIAVFVLCSATAFPAFSQTTTTSDEAAVRETVEHYLHGLKFNDVEGLKLAFYPEAKLFFVKRDQQLGQLTQEQWYKGFVSSAGQEEKGDLQITAVDITGNAASVKVVEVYEKSKYTDYLSLLKFAGGWKIVNKIYVAEPIKK
jgi:ketosteroid isomerase-like protein